MAERYGFYPVCERKAVWLSLDVFGRGRDRDPLNLTAHWTLLRGLINARCPDSRDYSRPAANEHGRGDAWVANKKRPSEPGAAAAE